MRPGHTVGSLQATANRHTIALGTSTPQSQPGILKQWYDWFAMNSLRFAVLLLAGMTLLSSLESLAQAPSAPVRIAVYEARARAILSEESVRFELPLDRPAGAAMRASAWILSPKGKRSGETAVDLRAGAGTVNIALPRPKDEAGKLVKELGWYRIGYRISAPGTPPLEGIVSVGAISPNLMELRLVRPGSILFGKPISLRVFAGNPVTREALRGVHLQGKLEVQLAGAVKGSKTTLVREAWTNGAGEAQLTYPGQKEVVHTASVTIVGTLKNANGGYAEASIDSDLTEENRVSIDTETDKPLHKPGETVHLRALAFIDGHPVPGAALTLTLEDPDDKELLAVPLVTNRFGIAAYDWKTSEQIAPGDYLAKFEDGDFEGGGQRGGIEIPIRRYDLPEFAVSATMDRGAYLEGETPIVRIHAGYLFGKPVAAGLVQVAHARDQAWNPETYRYEKTGDVGQSATLDANGDADLPLDVKADYKDFKGSENERFSDVDFRAIVTDASTGRSEPRKFTVRLTRGHVHAYINYLDGNDHEDDFILSTSHAEGGPISCKVSLDWIDDISKPVHAASATTNRYGLAKVHLRLPAHLPGESGVNTRFALRPGTPKAVSQSSMT